MPREITAFSNPLIKRVRNLRDKKHREAAGLFVIEGEKVVGELLAAGFPFTELFATPEWTGPRDPRVRAVTDDEMAQRIPSESEGVARNLKSLRATGIAFRIRSNPRINLKLLGIQSGTSVQMLDTYYLKRLSVDAAIEELL